MSYAYLAFLRAINVGGHTVKMEALRRHFAALGFAQVATFIASGNVYFETEENNPRTLEESIETLLRAELGFDVATFLRTPAEVAAIAANRPFPPAEMEGSNLFVAFLKAAPVLEAQQKLMTFRSAMDDFHIHNEEIYWLSRTKISESTFSGALLEKTIRQPSTMRNITTVRKLAAKYSGSQQITG